MDDAYRAYFRDNFERLEGLGPYLDRFSLRRRPELDPELRPAHYLVQGALERATSDFELRPDAELLLYLLALEFVARPVAAVRGLGELQGELPDDLAEDIRGVVEAAREKTDGDEISSHSIITALGARWDQLRTAGENIWG